MPHAPLSGSEVLEARQLRSVQWLIDATIAQVPAELRQASLFGSRARFQAREDSDIDILLIFETLPPDREPQARFAESLAERIAVRTGQPISVWSVSLADLELGNRTPMLVDALADSIVVWSRYRKVLPPVTFTPLDAVRCTRSLLERVNEGSEEFAWLISMGDAGGAARRLRDDLVRMCTADLLLRGCTRPRRGDAVAAYVEMTFSGRPPPQLRGALDWARSSFGADGRDENAPVSPPKAGLAAAVDAIEALRTRVVGSLLVLEEAIGDCAEPSDVFGTKVARIQRRPSGRIFHNFSHFRTTDAALST